MEHLLDRLLGVTGAPTVWLLGIALAMIASCLMAAGKPATLEELDEMRNKLAHRQRPLILNNDGNEPVYYCTKVDRDEFLSKRTSPLAGSQVSSIFYCTWSSGFGFFTHNTQIGEVFNTKEKPFDKNLTQELLDAGLDPLQMVIDWCRDNDTEVFWSMRMNDVHDGSYPPMVPQWKHEHPELLMGALNNRPKGAGDGRAWAGVDYAREEVRDRAFRFIQEVCRNYDVDGIELDFFRHLYYFKSRAWGNEVSQLERDKMSALISRIHRMTQTEGLRRGRPILLGIRVPDSVDYCRSVGLDVERWLAEGWVDLMAVTGYFKLRPWEDSVALGHSYAVPVYCCLSESRLKAAAGKIRNAPQTYRARATNVWNAGADGVYTFNAFDPDSAMWRELGDPGTVKSKDKHYFANVRGLWGANAYSKGGEQYRTIPDFSPERPIKLQPGERAQVSFPVGQKLAASAADGGDPVCALRLQFSKLGQAGDVQVQLNAKGLQSPEADGDWLEFPVEPTCVKLGANEIVVTLGADAAAGPVWTDSVLTVAYGSVE